MSKRKKKQQKDEQASELDQIREQVWAASDEKPIQPDPVEVTWTASGPVDARVNAAYDPTIPQSIESSPIMTYKPEPAVDPEPSVSTWTERGPVAVKNPMANATWIEDWAPKNQRIATWHVIAAGPSIKEVALKVDWSGKPAICCNGVPLLFRGVENWITIDPPRDALESWAGTDVTTRKFVHCTVEAEFERIVFRHWNRVGPSRDPFKNGLFWHGSVAMAAADLARVLGARRIIVWGLDYVDRSHAYDEMFPGMKAKGLAQWDVQAINERWKDMAHEMKYQGGPEILNANPGSLVKVLPMIDPKEALET